MFVIFSVFYILIAAAMIVLILLQNGAGADAGSGFGGGASATVFGARGSSTFLTRATGVLAGLFFLLSLAMGMYLNDNGAPKTNTQDLGVMSTMTEKAAATKAAPATGSEVPAAAPASANNVVPATTPAAKPAPVSGQGEVPAAPPAKH
ncbi:preprotein translocase subunit SecG [Rhodanobacter sp. AS-Z3]|uniref:preprotein translocase subunit SecG n=1 Tax=Rhodanobacter sp. AS-Z3 TaxID=3031330 RepID=UPI00247856F1|nr:preprotein translocase subunit SecG [Rhodanobacter sp. AS-Z3]WEN13881.1 preprotein translocase subunit SecG [Rhodanobacter sp. AS-Z3]